MRVASDVEKRREMGQIGIFSPLLHQLSYPAISFYNRHLHQICHQAKSALVAFGNEKAWFYAQLDANNGKQYKDPLQDARTVPQAVTEMQALKKFNAMASCIRPA